MSQEHLEERIKDLELNTKILTGMLRDERELLRKIVDKQFGHLKPQDIDEADFIVYLSENYMPNLI